MIFLNKNCLACVFCTRVWERHPTTLTDANRKLAKAADFSFLNAGVEKNVWHLECAKGQWSEALSGADVTEIRQKITKQKCPFFYSFKKGRGKFFPSIEEELRLARENRTESRASTSLIFSGAALGVSLLAFVLNALKIDPETLRLLAIFLGKAHP